jgi:8-oxo-dGTP diphosphatase
MARYYTEDENRAYYATLPTKHTGATVAHFNPAGEVLIVKPNYKPGWSLVGGVIDAAESPLAAAIRETSEEIGLHLAPERFRLLGVQYLPAGIHDDFLRITFSTQLAAEEVAAIKIPADELDEYKFVPIAQLAELSERTVTQGTHAILGSHRQVGYVEGVQLRGSDT